ncbi:lysozyme inhibitor LprI family protein [Acinetobacter bohemicus]|uniref:lysozyme inhibitor LprI family protein n=1 Tax=Acinetobacter TaxID=469 RepID=UPI00119598A1|nr:MULTISPECIES: lysozyme inhibitor LprI family protein [Acinetobacter]MCO8042429.1 lysozyme inhibitor LprI family protein [Acinetobacter sp. S4400-12]MCU7224726.1 lysozyme inhibitor LprI family protein [Acinetobacter bohemicus]TSH72588.1 DUF1311 domain-containing protein [Acinetobacter sp. RF15A]TSI16550.1 DUF1311 domain-containing protein [Acinetobacter sp. RF15B]
MNFLLKGLVIVSCLIVMESHAASFNCNKAETVTEKAICQHTSLNDADVKMSTTYNILRRLVPMGTRSVIQRDQVKWLQFRNRCRESVSCLSQVYTMRQQELDLHFERIYRLGPY